MPELFTRIKPYILQLTKWTEQNLPAGLNPKQDTYKSTVLSFVQYLEANIIFPKVVGKQLNISIWATLVAIIAGGIIRGVSGMILFIPLVAILKIVSDNNIEEMKALNIILNRDDHDPN